MTRVNLMMILTLNLLLAGGSLGVGLWLGGLDRSGAATKQTPTATAVKSESVPLTPLEAKDASGSVRKKPPEDPRQKAIATLEKWKAMPVVKEAVKEANADSLLSKEKVETADSLTISDLVKFVAKTTGEYVKKMRTPLELLAPP
jgi:hypothetical protein